MIYDLSVVIGNNTVTYPADPCVSVKRIVHLEDCGYNVASLSMGTHSGTHADLPLHYFNNGLDAAAAALDSFCGEAVFIEVPFYGGIPVSLDNIDESIVKKGDILVIRTGWEDKAGTEGFFEKFPYFSLSSSEKLVKYGIKAIGTDMPSVDGPLTNGGVHKMLLSNNIVIIEALVNLKPLVGKRCYFSAVPLKIEQGDGSPVRAYASL